MTFKGHIVSLLFPGGILIVAGGALMDVMPGFGLGIGVLGFLLLVAWPIFAIAVNIRHGQRLKRLQKQRDFEPVSITEATPPLHDDPDQELFKLLAGCGALILLSMYVVFLVVGRSALMLRIAGGGLALFGLALTVGVGSELADAGGVTSTSDIVVGIASVVMVVVGVWLLFTGRNTFKRVGRP